MVQGLNRLGHDAVIRSDNQNRDVSDLSATSTHRREGFVSRGVNERDCPFDSVVLSPHLVCTDVLGDASGFAGHHVGTSDGIQQLGLTVIDVTHHGYHRRTNNKVFFVLFLVEVDVEALEEFFVFVFWGHDLDSVAKLGTENLKRCSIQRLGRCRHFTELEQHRHQIPRGNVEAGHYLYFFGKIAD